jgi:hypothetical protein
MVAQPLRELPTLAILFFARTSLRSIFRSSGSSQYCFAQYATVEEVEAESKQNPPNLEIWFLHRWMNYTGRTVALRRAIFKQKKGFATISLGLIYLISTTIS